MLTGAPMALPSPSAFYHDVSIAGAELGTPTMMSSLANWGMCWSPRPPPAPHTPLSSVVDSYPVPLTGALSPRGLMTPASGVPSLDALSEMGKAASVRREPVVEPNS